MTERFGATLRRLVEASGKTNKQIGDMVGSQSGSGYLTHLQDGTFSPSPEKAARLAEVLNVYVEDLANFLLEAAGYKDELIVRALSAINDSSALLEGETLVLQRGRGGWTVSQNPE